MNTGIKDVNWELPDMAGEDLSDEFQPIQTIEEPIVNDPNVNQDLEDEPPISGLYQYLINKGITDPTKIKFENDNGEEEEIDFNTLNAEEQLTLLNEISDSGLSEHETEVVNFLRSNNVTIDQVVEYFAEERLKKYLEENPDQVKQKVYSIDEYGDDDLYLADLKSKFSDFTDEELLAKLDSAKANESLFKKEVDALRQIYKTEEDKRIELEKQEAEAQQERYYEDLKNNLTDAVSKFNEIPLDINDPESDALIVDDGEKEQIMSYLLVEDSNGESQLIKDLRDPNILIELAWYRTQGRDNLISGISKYWKDVLKAERKENAKLKKQIETGTNPIKPTKNEPKQPGTVPDFRSLGSKVDLQ